MTDYISRADAIEAVRKVWFNDDDRNDFKQKYYEMGNNDAVEDALEEIKKIPTVVAPTEFLISRYYAKDKAKEIIYSILDDTDYNDIESITHACLMMKIKILKMFDDFPSAEAKGDLISRQVLMDRLESFCKWCKDGRLQGAEFVWDCIVPNVPSAEADMSEYADRLWKIAYERGKREASAEAVQGKWKCMADCGVTECDQCGWSIEEYVGDYNYCPNCGARMKGGAE